MTEREALAARAALAAGVYSSATWPANQPMCQHHELSYALPSARPADDGLRHPAAEGGVTGLADAADVLEALPPDVVARFERQGWLLTRAYSDEIGASWEAAFGTQDRSAVERYCSEHAIEASWQPDGTLRTRQRRRAVVTHPGLRTPLLVQPDRVPQPVDPRPRCPGVPRRGVRRRRASVQHLVRRRVAHRGGRRGHDQRGVRGVDPSRALAGRGRDGGRQRPDRTQPRALLRPPRGGWSRSPSRRRSPDDKPADVLRHPRRPGPAGPEWSRKREVVRARRVGVPAARRGAQCEPAVVLPAVPRPPVLADHRPSRVTRRNRSRGRPQVDLELPRQRGRGLPRAPLC